MGRSSLVRKTNALGESTWVRTAGTGLLDLPPEILQAIVALILDGENDDWVYSSDKRQIERLRQTCRALYNACLSRRDKAFFYGSQEQLVQKLSPVVTSLERGDCTSLTLSYVR